MLRKDLEKTMNANMKVSEQCRIAAYKDNQVLGMIRRSITRGGSRAGSLGGAQQLTWRHMITNLPIPHTRACPRPHACMNNFNTWRAFLDS